MPSTRSGSSASGGAGEGEDSARLLEEAAAELSSEIAARKAAEERVAALQAQLSFLSRPSTNSRKAFSSTELLEEVVV